ncbi:MAG TPA: SLC13 family permease [Gemmatimonadaceae bacterium]|nr:SLC13 family permease [Gemmatimonadaceae bacterium]
MTEPIVTTTEDEAPPSARRLAALLAGPAAYLLLLALAPPTLARPAAHVLGTAGWMGVWWLTEAVPLGATSLLPLVLFPALGVTTMAKAAAPFANELVFLFLGGFFLAAALEHWRAHARIAYGIVAAVAPAEGAGGGRRIIFGVMAATAFISMWISNTATTAMMYPIALAIGALFGEGDDAGRMRTALMLGVAYAASIGGIGTLIGTPPNLIFAGAARSLAGRPIGFTEYMAIGVPIVAVLLPLCWLLLVTLFRARASLGAGARSELAARRAALGPLRGGERLTIIVFALTALAWVMRERKALGGVTIPGLADLAPGITDSTIAIAGALLLFVLTGTEPGGARRPLLTWREARHIPWEVLLVYGGGFSLATAMESSGLAAYLGGLMTALAGAPTLLLYSGIALIVLALSEIASNTAVAAMAMPLAASLGTAIGVSPVTLMLVTALAASTGFALPAATPPNLIVFGSGQITVRQMARAGVLLDVIAVGVIVGMVWGVAGRVLGLE